jgi:hypothetical protein
MKKLFLILALVPTLGLAEYKAPAEVRDLLNSGYGATTQLGTQMVDKKIQVLKGTYDFSVVGGSAGTAYNLKDTDGKDAKIPANAVITDCVIDVVTAPTSGGSATISIGTGIAATNVDLKAATAYGSYSGLVACIPTGSAATMIKTSSEVTPALSIGAAAALTAGKINVLLQYILSQ